MGEAVDLVERYPAQLVGLFGQFQAARAQFRDGGVLVDQIQQDIAVLDIGGGVFDEKPISREPSVKP